MPPIQRISNEVTVRANSRASLIQACSSGDSVTRRVLISCVPINSAAQDSSVNYYARHITASARWSGDGGGGSADFDVFHGASILLVGTSIDIEVSNDCPLALGTDPNDINDYRLGAVIGGNAGAITLPGNTLTIRTVTSLGDANTSLIRVPVMTRSLQVLGNPGLPPGTIIEWSETGAAFGAPSAIGESVTSGLASTPVPNGATYVRIANPGSIARKFALVFGLAL